MSSASIQPLCVLLMCLSEVLVLPKPTVKSGSRRCRGMNTEAKCITEEPVLEELKLKEREKAEAEERKAVLQAERQKKEGRS